MIYCVKFDLIAAHLSDLEFRFVEQTGYTLQYERGDELFTIRAWNENGDLPEIIVNDAFDAAGLPVPQWTVHWCD